MNVAICCIGKCENRYIKEFVEWYKNLGFSHIYLYDNNTIERFEEVIQNYIDDKFVTLIDFRKRTVCQLIAYKDCYEKYSNNHDWIFFIDIDEFLVLNKHQNISEFLSDKMFENAKVIGVNWMMYTDNNLIEYENKPLNERFTQPAPYDIKISYSTIKENDHIKIFVKSGFNKISFTNPHKISNIHTIHLSNGSEIKSVFAYDYDFTYAYLKHFSMKTIDEYINIKMKRGYPDQNYHSAINNLTTDKFFKLNQKTKEKLDFITKNILK